MPIFSSPNQRQEFNINQGIQVVIPCINAGYPDQTNHQTQPNENSYGNRLDTNNGRKIINRRLRPNKDSIQIPMMDPLQDVPTHSSSSSSWNQPVGLSEMQMNILNKRELCKEFLNNLTSGCTGEKIALDRNYVGEYKIEDILEALEEAKKTDSDKAVIKETIIGREYSNLFLQRNVNGDIVGGIISKQPQAWIPILEKISHNLISIAEDRESLTNLLIALSDITESKTFIVRFFMIGQIHILGREGFINWFRNGPFEEQEKLFNIYGLFPDEMTYEIIDSYIDSLDRYFKTIGDYYKLVMIALTDSIENILKPQVKFDNEDMPYGSYLSEEISEIITSPMILLAKHESYLSAFPVWLQKLLQTTLPKTDGVSISPKEYVKRYFNRGINGKHPLIGISNKINCLEVISILDEYRNYFTDAEEKILSAFCTFLFRDTEKEEELLALAFRSLCLVRDLKEFNAQLDLNKDDRRIYTFISDMKQRHINQFIDQINSIPSFSRGFIDKVIPQVRSIEELKDFFRS